MLNISKEGTKIDVTFRLDVVRLGIAFPCEIAIRVITNYQKNDTPYFEFNNVNLQANLDFELKTTIVMFPFKENIIELILIIRTEKGRKSAGKVQFDVLKAINTCQYEQNCTIENCPDRGATMSFAFSYDNVRNSNPETVQKPGAAQKPVNQNNSLSFYTQFNTTQEIYPLQKPSQKRERSSAPNNDGLDNRTSSQGNRFAFTKVNTEDKNRIGTSREKAAGRFGHNFADLTDSEKSSPVYQQKPPNAQGVQSRGNSRDQSKAIRAFDNIPQTESGKDAEGSQKSEPLKTFGKQYSLEVNALGSAMSRDFNKPRLDNLGILPQGEYGGLTFDNLPTPSPPLVIRRSSSSINKDNTKAKTGADNFSQNSVKSLSKNLSQGFDLKQVYAPGPKSTIDDNKSVNAQFDLKRSDAKEAGSSHPNSLQSSNVLNREKALEARVDSLTKDLTAKTDENQILRLKFDEKTKLVESLKNDLENLQLSLRKSERTFKEQIEEICIENDQLKKKLEQSVKNVENELKLKQTERELTQKNTQVLGYENELQASEEKRLTIKKRLYEIESNFKTEKEAIMSERDDLKNEKEEMSKKIEALTAELKSETHRATFISEKLENQQDEIMELERTNLREKEKLQNAFKQIFEMKEENASLTAAMEQLEKEKQFELNKIENERKKFSSDIFELKIVIKEILKEREKIFGAQNNDISVDENEFPLESIRETSEKSSFLGKETLRNQFSVFDQDHEKNERIENQQNIIDELKTQLIEIDTALNGVKGEYMEKIEHYIQLLAEKDKEIAEKTEQMENAQSEANQLSKKLEELIQQQNARESTKSDMGEHLNSLISEKEAFLLQVQSLNNDKKLLQEECDAIKYENEALNEELEEKQKELNTVSSNFTEARSLIPALENELKETRQEKEIIRESFENKLKDFAAKIYEVDALNKDKKATEEKLASLMEDNGALCKKTIELEDELFSLRNQIDDIMVENSKENSDFSTHLNSIREEKSRLSTIIDENKAEMTRMTALLKIKDAEGKAYQERTNSLIEENAKSTLLFIELKALYNHIENSSAQKLAESWLNKIVEKKYAEYLLDALSLNKDTQHEKILATIAHENRAADEELQLSKYALQLMQDNLLDSKKTNETLASKINKKKNKSKELKDENELIKKILADREDDVQTLKNEFEKLLRESESLKSELSFSSSDGQQKNSILEKLSQENQAFQNQIKMQSEEFELILVKLQESEISLSQLSEESEIKDAQITQLTEDLEELKKLQKKNEELSTEVTTLKMNSSEREKHAEAEIENLKEELKKYSDYFIKVSGELVYLTEERDGFATQVEENNLKITEISTKNATLTEERDTYKQELDNIRAELKSLKSQTGQLNELIEEGREKIDLYQKEVQRAEEENIELKERIEKLEVEKIDLTEKIADVDSVRIQLVELNEQLIRTSDEKIQDLVQQNQAITENSSTTILELEERVRDFEKSKLEMQQKLSSENKEAEFLFSEIQEKEEEISKLKSNLAAAEKKIEDLSSQKERLAEQEESFLEQIYQKEEEIQTLNDRVEKLSQDLQKKEEEEAKLTANLHKTEEQIKALQSTMLEEKRNSSALLSENNNTITQKNEHINQLEEDVNQLRKEKKISEDQIGDLKSKLASTQSSLREMNEEFVKANQASEKLSNQIENHKSELALLSEKSLKSKSKNKALKEKVSSAENDLNQTRFNKVEFENEMNLFQQKLDFSVKENEISRQKIAQSEAERNDQKVALSALQEENRNLLARLDGFKDKTQVIEKNESKMQVLLESVDKENNTLKVLVQEKNSEITVLKNSVLEHSEKIVEAQRSSAEISRELERRTATLENKERELAKIEKDKEAIQTKLEELQQARNNLTQSLNEKIQALDQLAGQLEALKARAKFDLDEKQVALHQGEDREKSLQQKIAELEENLKSLHNLQKDLQTANNKTASLDTAIKHLQDTNQALQEELQDAQNRTQSVS